jgi:hypothetical protein
VVRVHYARIEFWRRNSAKIEYLDWRD